jgi:hypothetical protein
MPKPLPPILLEYSKEMIRSNPSDMVKFSRVYFEGLLKESGFFDEHQTKVYARMEALFEINRTKSILDDYIMGEELSGR